MNLLTLIKNSNDFVGNKETILNLKNTLTKDKLNKFILIKGSSLTGKTFLIKQLLVELNINFKYLIASNLPNKKNINTFINELFKSKDVYQLILNKIQSRLIIIDNIETLTTNHKCCILELIKCLTKYSKTFIILITNKNHIKFSKLINDNSIVFNIINPTITELFNFIKKNTNLTDSYINNILKQSTNLKKLELLIGKNSIITNDNKTLFDITNLILTEYKSINNIINYYNFDKYLLPLTIHENYLLYINNLNISLIDKIKILNEIIYSFITYDKLDNHMYACQYWDLQNICGLIPCLYISYNISKYKLEKPVPSLKFTLYLNKVSLISINRKSIHKLLIKFNISDIYKILRLRYFLLQCIDKDSSITLSLTNILDYYNISKKELQSINNIYKSSI